MAYTIALNFNFGNFKRMKLSWDIVQTYSSLNYWKAYPFTIGWLLQAA
jgi:hypothetical protein